MFIFIFIPYFVKSAVNLPYQILWTSSSHKAVASKVWGMSPWEGG